MEKYRHYHPARSSERILKEALLKLIIILIVMIVMQLNACETDTAGVGENTSTAFIGHSVLIRTPRIKKRNKEHQLYTCRELEKLRKSQKAKNQKKKQRII